MEQIAIILLILTIVAAILETSFFYKWWHVLAFAVVCGIVVFSFYPYAIRQNKMILQDVLSNRAVLLNIATVLTIESLLFIGINIFQLQQYHGESGPLKPWLKWVIHILTYFPGFVFFGSLFYFEVEIFLLGFSFDFQVLAAIIALFVIGIIILGNWLVKALLPEKDLRLEMNYFLHFLQILMAAVIAADAAPDVRLMHSVDDGWSAIGGVALIFMGVVTVGFISYRLKKAKRNT